MKIQEALQQCCRLRHRDWLPYHFAEIRVAQTGSLQLYLIKPDNVAKPIDLPTEIARDDPGWIVLDHRSGSLSP